MFIPVKPSIYADGGKKNLRKDCRSSFPGFLRTGMDVEGGKKKTFKYVAHFSTGVTENLQ